jgi:hypothetical protein
VGPNGQLLHPPDGQSNRIPGRPKNNDLGVISRFGMPFGVKVTPICCGDVTGRNTLSCASTHPQAQDRVYQFQTHSKSIESIALAFPSLLHG